ncbi:molybdopterin molybdotransferase MoeA [Hoyosella sp. YIM 151337]|uniref:molybdopterin molybdotransferase MoeA n=1 Tax=Hoyosella sp. YIM 151337 TaxID=2992742 RepID=UPI002235FDAF|nr:gephyrin-like molybdotransferase Glp [Hoyosella sp. YIM 151337]MCW4351797.1 molybdopterin molybdotransferase MoeA [Hoyosella sp. YIM 151337]
MRSVTEHQAAINALVTSRPETEARLAAAAGRPLARDVIATRALPGFENSAMDGYAVRVEDLAGATAEKPVTLPVAEDIPAGRTDGPPLAPRTAHRIMTGAAVPAGADAVVPVELTDAGTSTVAIRSCPTLGQHVRRAGEDISAGEVALRRGQVLGAPQLALLASLGYATAPVIPPIRTIVLSTGSELVAPGQPLRRGEIYESNGIMIATAVREAGGEAAQLRFVSDDPTEFLQTLRDRAPEADLIITSGGVSAGAYEVVKDSLTEHGIEFLKVAMQPGMPQGCGFFEGTPIVTLPGNPVSALVSFEVFIRPALRRAMALPAPERPRTTARLTEPVTSPRGKRQFRRGVLDRQTGTVKPIGPPASHHLRWLASANCLVDVDEDVTALRTGDTVTVWDLDSC